MSGKHTQNIFKVLGLSFAMASMFGCASAPSTRVVGDNQIDELKKQMADMAEKSKAKDLALLRQSLLASPPAPTKPPVEEKRFSISVKELPAASVYQIVLDNANMNLVMSQDIRDIVTLNLKDVTIIEALDTMRDVYGLEYEMNGRRVLVSKPRIQNKTFQIDYMVGNRVGKSEVRVASGGVGDSGGAQNGAAGSNAGGATKSNQDGSKVTTTTQNDFWLTLEAVLKGIVSGKDGQEVIVNPQSGLLYVKAFPAQLRDVEEYVNRTQKKVARQVVLEAKIIEVVLSSGSQGGINWSAFDAGGNHKYSIGANPSAIFPQGGGFVAPTPLGGVSGLLNSAGLSSANMSGLGFAFTGTSFAALMSFLQTQGETRVLSAPRVAAMNNQKAVLKVGKDEFFVTNISSTSTSNGSSTSTTPTINVQPFFSGIALDVTPQIDDHGYVVLHVHPSVSEVAEKSKVVNLGSMGVYTLPLASSNVNESDTVVRLLNGEIVAIGGLMSSALFKDGQKVPFVGDVPVAGELFKQHADSYKKTELVILIKPTVINKSSDWAASANVSLGDPQ